MKITKKVFNGIVKFMTFTAVFILTLPFFFSLSCEYFICLGEKPSEVGDAIGGSMGPFVGLLAAFLTFLAFKVQYDANKQASKQFKNQALQQELDRFETHFFHLLDLHERSVENLSIDNIKGQACFRLMLNDFDYLSAYLLEKISTSSSNVGEYEPESLTFKVLVDEEVNIKLITSINDGLFHLTNDKFYYYSLVFELLYNGLNYKFYSSDIYQIIKLDSDFYSFNTIIDRVIKRNLFFTKNYSDFQELKGHVKINDYFFNYLNLRHLYIGHGALIGHHFRLLFRILDFIYSDKVFTNSKDKELMQDKYVKLIKSRISNDELVLLYYHSISKNFRHRWFYSKNIGGKIFSFVKDFKLFDSIIDRSVIPAYRKDRVFPVLFSDLYNDGQDSN